MAGRIETGTEFCPQCDVVRTDVFSLYQYANDTGYTVAHEAFMHYGNNFVTLRATKDSTTIRQRLSPETFFKEFYAFVERLNEEYDSDGNERWQT